MIVSDNGPEFTGRALDQWASQHGVRLHFIQPGKSTQNAFIESLNGTFREECLSADWFTDLLDARIKIGRWLILLVFSTWPQTRGDRAWTVIGCWRRNSISVPEGMPTCFPLDNNE